MTDPLGAKLVANLEKPGGNVTGMSDLSPIGKQLELIQQIVPTAKKIGVPYNPGEANSVTLLQLLKDKAGPLGMEIVEAAAPKVVRRPGGGTESGRQGRCDLRPDRQHDRLRPGGRHRGRQTDNKLPVFAGDTDSVKRGAIAAVGFDYYDVGRQTGKIVARILKGEKPGDIAVQGIEITQLFVNPAPRRKWVSPFPNPWSRAPSSS